MISGDQFVCPMPDLAAHTRQDPQNSEDNYDIKRFKRNGEKYTYNACDWYLIYNPYQDFIDTNITENDIKAGNIQVAVNFIMDDAPQRKNATFTITLHMNPTLEKQPERLDDYVPVWPCTHDHISIKGKNLLVGLRESDYQVMIGNKPCDDISVTMTEITCLPPVGEPKELTNTRSYTKVEVIVGTGCLPGYVYNLVYHRSVFECHITVIWLGTAAGVFVVGLLAIILCVTFCKCRKSKDRKTCTSTKELHYISPGSMHSTKAGKGILEFH